MTHREIAPGAIINYRDADTCQRSTHETASPPSSTQKSLSTKPSKWRTKEERLSICKPLSLCPDCAFAPSSAFFNLLPRPLAATQSESLLIKLATSPASALLPTASSRPTTTAPSRSPSLRSTRTVATPARTRPTLCAALCVRAARAMTR